MDRRQFSLSLLAAFGLANPALAQTGKQTRSMMVYKSPTCGCCNGWIEHLQAAGFEIRSENVSDMIAVKNRLGVPQSMWSCHTGVVGEYFVEGHVPAEDITRLLEDTPDGLGLAVPGMPVGSPGMEMGNRQDPYTVWLVKSDEPEAFASHGSRT